MEIDQSGTSNSYEMSSKAEAIEKFNQLKERVDFMKDLFGDRYDLTLTEFIEDTEDENYIMIKDIEAYKI